MIPRHVTPRLRQALSDRPVVLLHGARQVGKTTLVRAIAEATGRRYITLDTITALAAARSDPEGFLSGIDAPVVLDEVQRVPELLLAIKAEVDRTRIPGRFLLTGSANILLLPKLSETLSGRMEIVTLWPLSQGELMGAEEGFVDAVFDEEPPNLAGNPGGFDLLDRLLGGGYPEAAAIPDHHRRGAWFESYLTTILARDVMDLARIEGLDELPRLLAILASRPMAQLNMAELGRSTGLPASTLKRYFGLLVGVFLVRATPPWYANIGKRLVKTPKITLTDSGLLAHLVSVDRSRLANDRPLLGGLLENFVAMEITKQIGWSTTNPRIFHLRTHEGHEVDLVLEARSGALVGIEVKVSGTVTGSDFKGLRTLAQLAPDRFHRGLVLYTGREVVPFGHRLHAVPIEALWSWSPRLSRASPAQPNVSPGP